MTLTCCSNSLGILCDFMDLGANNTWTNEDRPVFSAKELQPIKCTCQRCIDYVDIAGRSSARRRQTRVGWGNKLFSSTMHDFSKTVGMRLKLLLMTNRKLHMRFRLAPSMTLNCYKFEFSENFVGFRRFGRQQLLNECQGQRCTHWMYFLDDRT